MFILFSLIFSLTFLGSFGQTSISTLDEILTDGIKNHVYPGVVALAGNKNGEIFYSKSFGTFEYLDEHPNSPNVSISNLYDIASVTKVLSTTNAIALLYQNGYLNLNDKISTLLQEPKYGEMGGKENVTVLNCLLHNAGLLGDPEPGYYDPAFNCPNKFESEDFSCLDQVYQAIVNEKLVTPPGSNYVYSDTSFMTLQMVIGAISYRHRLVQVNHLRSECFEYIKSSAHLNKGLLFTCYFEAYVRKYVFQEDSNWLEATTFLPAENDPRGYIPTMDTSYTKEIRQGNVSDSNCYAMGGMCGHAGLFTSGPEAAKILQRLSFLSSSSEQDPVAPFPGWVNVTTMKLFTTEYNSSQSSRALGWTINDPNVYDYGYTNSCGKFSTKTFMHIGYTGTCVCVDPLNGIWSVVFTNREYEFASSDLVKAVYRQFNSAIFDLFV